MLKRRKLIKKKRGKRALSYLERRFAVEYVNTRCNGKEAYHRATGVEGASAEVMASKWLRKERVNSLIQRLMNRALEGRTLTSGDVIRGIIKIADADHRKLYDENGEIKPIHELDDDTAAAIVGVKHRTRRYLENDELIESRTTEVTFAPRLEALKLLGKFKGLFQEGPSIGISVGEGANILVVPQTILDSKEWEAKAREHYEKITHEVGVGDDEIEEEEGE